MLNSAASDILHKIELLRLAWEHKQHENLPHCFGASSKAVPTLMAIRAVAALNLALEHWLLAKALDRVFTCMNILFFIKIIYKTINNCCLIVF